MISDYEKHIYNTHLRASRQHQNKPYNLRKDFSDIDDKTISCLKKLSYFFNKHKEIDLNSFFSASYKLYKDEKHFDLCYFNTLKAIKAYTIFYNNINNLDPDVEEQLNYTKKSLVFIYNFCKSNNIQLQNYLLHITNNIYTFLLHLKNRDINLYSLFSFDNLNNCLSKTDRDVLRFMFEDDFINNVNFKKIKFLNSLKCKHLVVNGLDRLKNNLKNELNIIEKNIS
jgi:hypothetical protein